MKTRKLCIQALSESFDVRVMNHVAQRVVRNYDIHERTGFPDAMSIPGLDAAKQIVADVLQWGRLVELVQHLARISRDGISGRTYRISGLTSLIHAVEELGYRFENEDCTFYEDTTQQKTRNWGVLEEGKNYILSLLRIDIVENSRLVREYSDEIIQQTYADLRRLFRAAVEERHGRVWNWEGDGATAAFYGQDTQLAATLSAISLMHELFFYNSLHCRLHTDLRVRAAVHNGQIEYNRRFEHMKGPALSTLVDIETRYSSPQSVCLSETVYTGLTNEVAEWLTPVAIHNSLPLYKYELQLGA